MLFRSVLAYELTGLVHGEEEAEKAQKAAQALFAGGGDKSNTPSTALTESDFAEGSIGILDLMVKCKLAPSKKEARRLVEQGGVLINDEKAADPAARFGKDQFSGEFLIKKGKKTFHRVTME